MADLKNKLKRISAFQYIIFGFIGVILVGALLLMLPISSQTREVTSFADTLFTAVSATCVTGLIVQDTATHWSIFGQAIILILIQIGGLGVVTIAASLSMIAGRKINLIQRDTMAESVSAPQLGGIVKITKFILKTAFAIEFSGAALMMYPMIKKYGAIGIWKAVFVSISAFCNAGFDLMGTADAKFVSLVPFADDPIVIVIICFLIISGGIGFFTWDDIKDNGFRFHRYRMQSKAIIVTSAVLIAIPLVLYFFIDYSDEPLKQRILYSLFQAVTPRTAGFNTTDYNQLTGGGRAVMICLMLVGGAPGSTAGGMKVTTVAVLFANMTATFKRRTDGILFRRRIAPDVTKKASTVLSMYIFAFVSSAIIISNIEGLPLTTCLFETASAVGTVGLTLGITPTLGMVSRGIIILLMYLGRVGALTFIYAAVPKSSKQSDSYPHEKISVG